MEEHDDYGISSKVVDLQTYEDVTEKKKPKVKAHGTCYCILQIRIVPLQIYHILPT